MSHPRTSGFAALAVAAGLASALAVPGAALAQTTYGVALLSDYSGPYADIMPMLGKSREAVLDWWNAEVGAKLGVKLNYKNFDTRYDAAQTASLWPGIKSEMKPIVVLGLGGPDVAALGQRLPDDGVPLFMVDRRLRLRVEARLLDHQPAPDLRARSTPPRSSG